MMWLNLVSYYFGLYFSLLCMQPIATKDTTSIRDSTIFEVQILINKVQILKCISFCRFFLLEICLRRRTKLFPETGTEILRVTKTDLIGDFCDIIQPLIQQYFGFLKPHVPNKLHRGDIGQTFEFFIERISPQTERIGYLINT